MAQPLKRQRLMTPQEAQDDVSPPHFAHSPPDIALRPERRELYGDRDPKGLLHPRNHYDHHNRRHSPHSTGRHALLASQPQAHQHAQRHDIATIRVTAAVSVSPTVPSDASSSLPSPTANSSNGSPDGSNSTTTGTLPPLPFINLVISAAYLENSLTSSPSWTSMLGGSSSTPRPTPASPITPSSRITSSCSTSSTASDDIVSAQGFPVVPASVSSMSGITPSLSPTSALKTQSTTFVTSSTGTTTVSPSSTSSSSVSSSDVSVTPDSVTSSAGIVFGAGVGASSASATPSNASLNQKSNSTNGPSTPVVVGSVVGGLAGLCVFLVAALLFLRWYKKKRDTAFKAIGAGPGSSSGAAAGPQMTDRSADPAAIGSAVGLGVAGAGLVRGLNRTPQMSPTLGTPRSFERVAGRKLPSQFSPGMEGPSTSAVVAADTSAAAAVAAAYPSGVSSQYPSGGTFTDTQSVDNSRNNPFADPPLSRGVATLTPTGRAVSSPRDEERYMPGPARTPTLHQGKGARTSDQAHLAAPGSSIYGTSPDDRTLSPSTHGSRPSYIRSQASYDSARSSRFTEDV